MHTFVYGRPTYVHMQSAGGLHGWVPDESLWWNSKDCRPLLCMQPFCFTRSWATDFQIRKQGDLFQKGMHPKLISKAVGLTLVPD